MEGEITHTQNRTLSFYLFECESKRPSAIEPRWICTLVNMHVANSTFQLRLNLLNPFSLSVSALTTAGAALERTTLHQP